MVVANEMIKMFGLMQILYGFSIVYGDFVSCSLMAHIIQFILYVYLKLCIAAMPLLSIIVEETHYNDTLRILKEIPYNVMIHFNQHPELFLLVGAFFIINGCYNLRR